MNIGDITKDAVLISENASLYEAVTMLVKQHTNTLLVTGDDGELVGEVSISDVYDAVIPAALNGDEVMTLFKSEATFNTAVIAATDRPVFEFMSTDFTPVSLNDDLITIAAQAVGFQRSRIPVVDKDNRPIGIISRQGLKHLLAKNLDIAVS